jgi:hypothetical protein
MLVHLSSPGVVFEFVEISVDNKGDIQAAMTID